MRLTKSTACALAFAVAAVGMAYGPTGCGSSLKSIYISADHFPSAYAEALCTSLQHCCDENRVSFNYNTCTAGWRALIQQRFSDPNAAALANYDPKAATDCVAQVHDARTVSCAPEPKSISAARDRCQQIFTGKKPPGAACTTTAECAPQDGTIVSCAPLVPGADGGGQLPLGLRPLGEPVCVATPIPEQGVPCTITPPRGCDANPGLFCDPGTLTCLPRADQGGPCLASVPASCLPGNYCVTSSLSGGLCAPALPVGSPCTTPQQCDTTSTCDLGATKTCIPKKAAGTSCATDAECATGLCDTVAKTCLKNVIATSDACNGVGP